MAVGFLKTCYLAYFSNPSCDRVVYRHVAKRKPRRILEIGIGTGRRTARLLDMVIDPERETAATYTGIDLFEARTDSPTLSLKQAYQLVRRDGVKAKLVPGDALSTMTLTANAAADTDLILIDASIGDDDLRLAWKYFPRMMHANTLVLRQTKVDETTTTIQAISLQAIEELAKQCESSAAA